VKKTVPVILFCAVVGAAAWIGYQRFFSGQRGLAAGELLLHGNVDVRDAQLAFFGQERIAEVLVEEGTSVEPGQLLARQHSERLLAEIAGAGARVEAQQALLQRLENGTRPEEVEQARARVAAAQVRAANAERVIERLRNTSASGASSARERDDGEADLGVSRATLSIEQQALALALAGPREEDVAQARATLEALRADLALLQQRLTDSELRAPSKGVIQSRILEPGEMASPERPVLTLALTDPKWVRAWVPEPQLGRIAVGMQAHIRSDSFGGRDYAGWVGFISPVAEFTPKAVETDELRTRLVYEVRIFVQDPAHELRLGMPVTVRVDTNGGRDHAHARSPEGGG